MGNIKAGFRAVFDRSCGRLNENYPKTSRVIFDSRGPRFTSKITFIKKPADKTKNGQLPIKKSLQHRETCDKKKKIKIKRRGKPFFSVTQGFLEKNRNIYISTANSKVERAKRTTPYGARVFHNSRHFSFINKPDAKRSVTLFYGVFVNGKLRVVPVVRVGAVRTSAQI